MKKIKLTSGKYAIVDDRDYKIYPRSVWRMDYKGYAIRYKYKNQKRTIVFMHREIMGDPLGMIVDHINHNPLDNRRSNLRICTKSENCRNRSPNKKGKSRYKGVNRVTGCDRWQAEIATNINGLRSRYYLGSFKTQEQAALAYNKKAKELFGEFALLNKI